MDANLAQNMLNVVFKGSLLYLSPILFLFTATLMADRFIELIKNSITLKSNRRNSY